MSNLASHCFWNVSGLPEPSSWTIRLLLPSSFLGGLYRAKMRFACLYFAAGFIIILNYLLCFSLLPPAIGHHTVIVLSICPLGPDKLGMFTGLLFEQPLRSEAPLQGNNRVFVGIQCSCMGSCPRHSQWRRLCNQHSGCKAVRRARLWGDVCFLIHRPGV